MPETPTLRQTECDLFDAAAALRDEEIPALEREREELVAAAEAEFGDAEDAPQALHLEYQQLTQQLRELIGTADTYEHYAEQWADDSGGCVFTLEELNGDEWAATVDAVRAEVGGNATNEGEIPEGYGRVKALEYGVVSLPSDACPADPGVWPAPIVNELYTELESITAPDGVSLGNSSLSEAMGNDDTPRGLVEIQDGDPEMVEQVKETMEQVGDG